MIKMKNRLSASGFKKMNKRGNGIVELIYFSIFVFVFLTISWYAFMAYKDVNADIQADADMSAEAKASAQATENSYPTLFDGLVVLLFGLLWLVVLAAAYFSTDHPLFALIMLLVAIFMMVIGGIISNVYDELQAEPEFSGYASSFPMTNFLFENYLVVVGVMAFSALIVFVMRGGTY